MPSALRALGQVARQRVASQINPLTPIAEYLATIVSNNPLKSASQILSRQDVISQRQKLLGASLREVLKEVGAASTAGVLLGGQMVKKEFEKLGASLPSVPNQIMQSALDEGYLRSVSADVRRSFLEFEEDLGARISQVFAATTAPPEAPNPFQALAQARASLIPGAVDTSIRRLSARLQASASVIPVRQAAEQKLRTYQAFERANPGLKLVKEWRTTSASPCSICLALHGSQVGLGEEFDYHAETNLRVYRDLRVPPRHPNCACELVLVLKPADEEAVKKANESPPISDKMTAEEIRQMPETKFSSLVGFLRGVLRAARRMFGV